MEEWFWLFSSRGYNIKNDAIVCHFCNLTIGMNILLFSVLREAIQIKL